MGEIIQLKKTRMPRQRDAFYQAIPVNEIQGRFFYFGRNKISDVELFKQEKDKVEKHAEALPEDRDFQIFFDPRYGVPGALAYRIWTGIEKFLSDSGSTFDGRLKLSTRQIAKLAGRTYSGKTAKEIALAIKQLQESSITYWYSDKNDPKDDGTPRLREESFSMLDKVSIVREDRKSAPHYFIITVPEIILGFLFHERYFFCMSWDRVKDLSPQAQSVSRILYRYMSYRYSKAKTEDFRYTKDYATMCSEWFGDITPYSKKSEIIRKHLAPRFDPIVGTDLLSAYTVEANKSGGGFNVHFTPGKEFFVDFAAFYKKQLPLDFKDLKSSRDPHTGHPETNMEDGAFALLAHFHELWFGESAERDYLNAEIQFAQKLLQELVYFDEAKRFVSWAVERARETKFDMQTFNGLKQYQMKWKAERKKEDARLQKIEAERAEREAEERKEAYEQYRKDNAQNFIDALSTKEQEELRQEATTQLSLELPGTKKFFTAHIRAVERRIVCEKLDLPDFEEWLTSKE